jgi:PilZ domain
MNESTPTPERRNSPRRLPRASVRAYLRLGGLDLGSDLALSLLDLSEGGAGLMVKQPIEIGKEVSVGLEGQTQPRPIVRVANVVWCMAAGGAYALGVCFQKALPYRAYIDLTQTIREAEQNHPILDPDPKGASATPPNKVRRGMDSGLPDG